MFKFETSRFVALLETSFAYIVQCLSADIFNMRSSDIYVYNFEAETQMEKTLSR